MFVRGLFAFGFALLLAGCGGGSRTVPPATAQSTFRLAPSSIDLTPDLPADTFNGQSDAAGVTYTPSVSSACTTAGGSIVVGGTGVAQLDAAGVPLLFTVAASGVTPPPTCIVTVSGSDGTAASVTVNYSSNPVTDLPDARHRLDVTPGATPSALSFSSLATQILTPAGFSGTITANVTCKSASSGVTVSPSSGPGPFVVVPFGQGSISNACTIVLGDQQSHTASVGVALSIGALAKFTLAPAAVQFGCTVSATPLACRTLTSTALAESGTHAFAIVTRPTLEGTCAKAFYGPLTMTTDGLSFSQSVSGSAVSVKFAGALASQTLSCSQILMTDGESPAQRLSIAVASGLGSPPADATVPAPACTGADSHVAVANAPHGMYVWNPYKVDGGKWEAQMESSVVGVDRNLCGVSLLVEWNEVESRRGVFDWSTVVSQAQPYVNHGLTVNLLFVDASETGVRNSATPAWVTDPAANGGDGVDTIGCSGQVPYPNYLDPKFEADWEALIAAAIAEFSQSPPAGSSIATSVGYMRFGIGAGTEAYPAHVTGADGGCLTQWQTQVGFTFDKWVTHTRRIVNAMGAQNANGKQLMIALNEVPGYPNTIYDYPNDTALAAANNHIGFGTENLGIGSVADVGGALPHPCNPQIMNGAVYWCQAFSRHAGVVPFEFQPIESVADPLIDTNGKLKYTIDFANLLAYALVNNTQIFELYPQDWIEANATPPPFSGSNVSPSVWKGAMSNTAAIVGANPNIKVP